MGSAITLSIPGDFGVKKVGFRVVTLADLNVDKTYQRDETTLIDTIAEMFNPLAFGAIIVGEREDGSLWIVDGLQRTRGAMQSKENITHGPAMVFKSTGREMEAEIFRYLNEFRKPVGPLDVFRAALQSKADFAVSIDKTIKGRGFRIASRAQAGKALAWPTIQAIQTVRFIHRKGGAELLDATLGLIVECWDGEVETLQSPALRGVSHLCDQFGVTLEPDRMKRRLGGMTMSDLIDKAKTYKQKEARDGNTVQLYAAVYAGLRTRYGRKVPPRSEAHPRPETEPAAT